MGDKSEEGRQGYTCVKICHSIKVKRGDFPFPLLAMLLRKPSLKSRMRKEEKTLGNEKARAMLLITNNNRYSDP